MHVHLDPVGGVAGDMFAAALLDALPEIAPDLQGALERSGVSAFATLSIERHRDRALVGSLVRVEPAAPSSAHRRFGEIRAFLERADLARPVRARALHVFELLAEAEGAVHGEKPEDVTFHEVGAWDSIADIVAAGWLIETIGASWSCGRLPLGSGRVSTAHGPLPVPAPAAARLLEGMPCFFDGVDGERVTPTGAALLRHLKPSFGALSPPGVLRAAGVGFGSRELTGVSNVLRALVFAEGSPAETLAPRVAVRERVAVAEFEVDDQTAEDLAVALDRVRGISGVLDVVQVPVFGKKGRLTTGVRVLAVPERLSAVVRACFEETTTLGVRTRVDDRARLVRASATIDVDGRLVRVKRAKRPDGTVTTKAEIEDLATGADGRHAREDRRRRAERPPPPDE